MEQMGSILGIGMPIFAVLVLGEKLYGYWKGNDTTPWMDAIASSYSGITFVMRLLLGFGITIVSYEYMVEHLAIVHMKTSWIIYVVAFVVLDFQGYWTHRFVHEINFLWNRHLIHHSSEEYNLAVALRQSISDLVQVLFFLSIPAALLGLSPSVIAIVYPIFTFSQYWYHTRHIGKLGILEHIIVTPSHHRVHHAMNPIYLDKNYSAIFIIWDKLFGTFQEELESEAPVYGITRPSRSYNPITVNFQHIALLFKDAWRAEKWSDKLTIWFRPTGWRPEGFEEKYPVEKITDRYNFKKYQPSSSKALLRWSLFQFFVLFFSVMYILQDISYIGLTGMYLLAAFVFAQVYSATELMNCNRKAPIYAGVAAFVSFAIYTVDPSFIGMTRIYEWMPFVWLAYCAFQIVMSMLLIRSTEKLSFSELQGA